jgi:hypothetical protein
MSMECGECERDLRGGHDISCSRYNLKAGVAYAMLKAIGQRVDEEEGVPPEALKMAIAAIDHIRLYNEERVGR